MKTAPQWNLGAEVVKDLPLFGPEQWSFWVWSSPEYVEDLFFGNHLNLAGKKPSNFGEDLFFGDHLILAGKTPQSNLRLMKIWVK